MTSSPGAGPSNIWHPPTIPPPTPIPLGALPIVSDGSNVQAARKMSIPGSRIAYTPSTQQYPRPLAHAHAAHPHPNAQHPHAHPYPYVRDQPLPHTHLRLGRLRSLPRRLMHPPPLPAFMQEGEPQGRSGHAAVPGGGKGKEAKRRRLGFPRRDRSAGVTPAEQSKSNMGEERQGAGSVATGPNPSAVVDPVAPPATWNADVRLQVVTTEPIPGTRQDATAGLTQDRKKIGRRWNWGIAPTFEVELEDVLQRRHLPPLGLKDFEEWLLFVEDAAENLYFILWLREYTTRYQQWVASAKSLRSTQPQPQPPSQPQPYLQPQMASYTFPHRPDTQPHMQAPERPFASLGLALSRHASSVISLEPHPNSLSSQSHVGVPPGDTHPYRHDPQFPHNIGNGANNEASDEGDADSAIGGIETETDSLPWSQGSIRTRQIQLQPPVVEERRMSSATGHLPPNPALALFYLRARETFLTPNAPYELKVSSDVLAVFHTGSAGGSGYGYTHPLATAFGASKLPPPPDLETFDKLAEIVEARLRASLRRLVVATYNNVGMPRAYCGSAGGFVIGLIGSVPPLASSFVLGGPRWYRILALPGMWLGMTIFISAWYGVCMMIYVFGDLRQLRSFELARPVHPLFTEGGKTDNKDAASQQPVTRPPKPHLHLDTISANAQNDPAVKMITDAPADTKQVPEIRESHQTAHGDDDGAEEEHAEDEDEDEDDEYDEEDDEMPQIEISDAFYDEHPSPEGPATAPAEWYPSSVAPQTVPNPLWPDQTNEEPIQHATAAFIGPYVFDGNETASIRARSADVEQPLQDAAAFQPLAEFDFDGLPPRRSNSSENTHRRQTSGGVVSSFTESCDTAERGRRLKSKARAKAEDKNRDARRKRSPSPAASSMSGSVKARRWWSWWWWTFVERIESFCSPENAVDALERSEYEDEKARTKGKAIQERAVAQGAHELPLAHAPQLANPANTVSPPRKGTRPSTWREGLKRVYLAVPAFASPLTPVLNPLVKRAQWEIVVRSALMALFLSCIVIGSLLAVPE